MSTKLLALAIFSILSVFGGVVYCDAVAGEPTVEPTVLAAVELPHEFDYIDIQLGDCWEYQYQTPAGAKMYYCKSDGSSCDVAYQKPNGRWFTVSYYCGTYIGLILDASLGEGMIISFE